MAPPVVAIGVDGAPDGWLAVCLRADGHDDEAVRRGWTELHLVEDMDGLARLREGRAAVAIDVPIGLPEPAATRACDIEARKILGKRASSVFNPPARYMLAAAGDYPRIRELVAERRETEPDAKGLSAQGAGITPKVREVDDWVRVNPDSEQWLWECHPELCFWRLAEGVCEPKSSTAGIIQRLQLVRARFPDLEERLVDAPWVAKVVGLADILDAYAALTTAIHCARGEQEELGDDQRDAEDLPMRMAL